MDRLAAFYHWADPQGLEQALAVARRHRIDARRIERWSKEEGKEREFRKFAEAVERGIN